MEESKLSLLAGAAMLTATSAFADQCHPHAIMNYTNDEGVVTTVHAVLNDTVERGSPDARNLSINAHMALLMSAPLRSEFGDASIHRLTSYAGPQGLCVDTAALEDATASSAYEQVEDTGIHVASTGGYVTVLRFTGG